MTICLSYIYKTEEIISFCDSFGSRNGENSKDHKKYVYLDGRKILFLFSCDGPPMEDFMGGIRGQAQWFLRKDIIGCAIRTKQLMDMWYKDRSSENKKFIGSWDIILCGFDGETPQIYEISSSNPQLILKGKKIYYWCIYN